MSPAPERLLFGTAGVPLSTAGSSSIEGIERAAELGLDCLEIEFVNGVKMGQDTARKISLRAGALNIGLSAHAPYFINLNSEDRGKRMMSQERILGTARMASACGASSVVFHAGFYGKKSPDGTYQTIREELAQVVSLLRRERLPVTLRIESMGKRSQFGTLEEVLFLCREIDGLQPCLDFSHIHAREGKANTYSEFVRILSKVEKKLGGDALGNVHIHISGSHYNDTGELRHLNLKESDFRYDEWIQALRDFNIAGLVICESPNLETDALMLKGLYTAQARKNAGRSV